MIISLAKATLAAAAALAIFQSPQSATAQSQPAARNELALSIAIDALKTFEGLSLTAYSDSADVPTIGYGHTDSSQCGPRIVEMTQPINRAEAVRLLNCDAERAQQALRRAIKVPLTANQEAALICLTFNIGADAMARSTLVKLINDNRLHEAAEEFLKWTKANGVVLRGLIIRREAERLLFLT